MSTFGNSGPRRSQQSAAKRAVRSAPTVRATKTARRERGFSGRSRARAGRRICAQGRARIRKTARTEHRFPERGARHAGRQAAGCVRLPLTGEFPKGVRPSPGARSSCHARSVVGSKAHGSHEAWSTQVIFGQSGVHLSRHRDRACCWASPRRSLRWRYDGATQEPAGPERSREDAEPIESGVRQKRTGHG
jgi:hypothetical protein